MTAGNSDSMQKRADAHRYKLWVLMRMDRRLLAAGIAGLVFASMLGLNAIGPSPIRRVIETSDGLWWVFSSLVTAIITVVALVVSVNQLVLSQELGALGDQRERMQEAEAFREDVESWLDVTVSPPDPAAFMQALLVSIQSTLEELPPPEQVNEPLETFSQELATDADSVARTLEEAQFGTFDVIFASLNFDYSWNLFEARRLLNEQQSQLDEETQETLEALVTILSFFGPAREHFKTLYFQWELVNLSRAMLYSAVPALVVALGMLLYVDAEGVTGTTMGIDSLAWLVALGISVALVPFFILGSYILRIATVAKRTLAIGPFVLRETEQATPAPED